MYICRNSLLALEKVCWCAETMGHVTIPSCNTCVLFIGCCATNYKNFVCVNTIYHLKPQLLGENARTACLGCLTELFCIGYY